MCTHGEGKKESTVINKRYVDVFVFVSVYFGVNSKFFLNKIYKTKKKKKIAGNTNWKESRTPASNTLIPAAAGGSQPVTRSDIKLEKPLGYCVGNVLEGYKQI